MITFSENQDIPVEQLLFLYKANHWSSARQPDALRQAMLNSHAVVSAWDSAQLVGVGNAISDGFLVVYYPHLLVHPDYQRQGIGRSILERLKQRYEGLHMQMLVADGEAIAFYEHCGFRSAGNTVPMWIYDGEEHS